MSGSNVHFKAKVPDAKCFLTLNRLVITYLVLLWLGTDTLMLAQSVGDTIEIDEITIHGQFGFNNNFEYELSDSLLISNQISSSAASFLNQYSSLYSRTYGTGLYSSISLRGNSHTQVKWNDFDINNTMLGVADLSILAINPVSTIRINANDNSPGSTGGTIKISDNNYQVINGLSADLYYSTLDNKSFNAVYGINKNRLKYFFGFGVQENENRFKFESGNEIKIVDNSASSKYNVSCSSSFVTGNHVLRVNVFYNYNSKKIPASRYEGFSNARQLDENLKTGIHYDLNFKKILLKLRTGIFYDRLDYNNDKSADHSQSQMLTSESGIDLFLAKSNFLNPAFGLTNKIHTVKSTVYDVDFDNIIYFYAGIKKRFKRFNSEVKINSVLFNGKLHPFFPNLLIKYTLNSKSELNFTTGRNLRLPTYNDRFWNKNVNYDLLPEKSYYLDLKYRFKLNDHLETDVIIYYKKLNDNIMWLPEDGIWKAANIDLSNSYGIETELKVSLEVGKIKINLNNEYKYNKTKISDNDKGIFLSEALYYPVHLFYADQSAVWKKTFFRLSQRFSGKVITNFDNSEFLDPWYLIDIDLAHEVDVKNFSVKIIFKVENTLDIQYETIKNYPQPGRVFSLGMIFRQRK